VAGWVAGWLGGWLGGWQDENNATLSAHPSSLWDRIGFSSGPSVAKSPHLKMAGKSMLSTACLDNKLTYLIAIQDNLI
jgi:hypothetical protein